MNGVPLSESVLAEVAPQSGRVPVDMYEQAQHRTLYQTRTYSLRAVSVHSSYSNCVCLRACASELLLVILQKIYIEDVYAAISILPINVLQI